MTITATEPLEAPAEFFDNPALQPKQILFGTQYTGEPSLPEIETRYQQLSQKWTGQQSVLTSIEAAREFLTSNTVADGLAGVLKKGAFGRVQKVVEEISEFKLKCPSIAVIGGENQGKSSMLERIVKHAIFPRDRRTSTLLPITFTLCNIGDTENASIKVRRISVDGNEVYDEILFEVSDSDERIYDAVVKAQQEAAKNIENEKVEVIVKAKNVPDLVFVDYPGLTSTNATKKTRIEQLTKECIQRSDTLLVCVISATCESLDDIPVAGMLQHHSKAKDNPWKRAVCVLTKCDKVSGYDIDNTADRLRRIGDETKDINCDIVGVVNRDTELTKRTKRNVSFEEARWQEFLWYKKNMKTCDQNKFGIDAVLMNLNKLIEEHIVAKWVPDQIAEINKKQGELEEELIQLGRQPSPWLCKQMIAEVQAHVLNAVSKKEEHFFLHKRSVIRKGLDWQSKRILKSMGSGNPVRTQVLFLREWMTVWNSNSSYSALIVKMLEPVVDKLLAICTSSSLPIRFERFTKFKGKLETKLKELLLSRVEDSVELMKFVIRDLKRHLSSQGKLQRNMEELESSINDQFVNVIVCECIVPGVEDFVTWLRNRGDEEVENDFLGDEYFNGNTGYRDRLSEKITRCVQAKSTIRFKLLKYDTRLGIDQKTLSKICTEKRDVKTYLSYVTQVVEKIESSDDKFCDEMVTKLRVPHDLMSVMKLFLEDSMELQLKSLEALCGLCRTDENRKRIADMGGVDRCVLAMERYRDDEQLLEICKNFLKNLACNTGAVANIIKARATIESQLKLVKGSEEWKEILRVSETVVLSGHSSEVRSVAFNHDGTRIASSSVDKTIRIWDVKTRTQIGEPLQGHSNTGRSVVFNHDGTRIVSGSADKTIRIWDVETKTQIGEPLQGHSSSVNSVAFNHDGTRIVSGSNDQTIRIWDVETRTQIGEPLQGHSRVNSVAFNHDGTRIVSSSNRTEGNKDNTIRIWDVETRTQIGEPLQGHSSVVTSVAFNHDGTRIVSGSKDKTIRIWDVETRTQIGEPLQGHSYSVESVAFNHDGTRLVSCSDDNTIRVWDAELRKQICEPLQGHSNTIRSIAINHDGTRIVSGSKDNTIRIWDLLSVEIEGITSTAT